MRPDGKTQVTVGYDGDRPVSVDSIVISSQHAAGVSLEELRADLITHVINPVLKTTDFDTSTVRHILNPGGEFVIGGPVGDAGLAGRKIIVDTYGGMARHGGGAFSGNAAPVVATGRDGKTPVIWDIRKVLLSAGGSVRQQHYFPSSAEAPFVA